MFEFILRSLTLLSFGKFELIWKASWYLFWNSRWDKRLMSSVRRKSESRLWNCRAIWEISFVIILFSCVLFSDIFWKAQLFTQTLRSFFRLWRGSCVPADGAFFSYCNIGFGLSTHPKLFYNYLFLFFCQIRKYFSSHKLFCFFKSLCIFLPSTKDLFICNCWLSIERPSG